MSTRRATHDYQVADAAQEPHQFRDRVSASLFRSGCRTSDRPCTGLGLTALRCSPRFFYEAQ